MKDYVTHLITTDYKTKGLFAIFTDCDEQQGNGVVFLCPWIYVSSVEYLLCIFVSAFSWLLSLFIVPCFCSSYCRFLLLILSCPVWSVSSVERRCLGWCTCLKTPGWCVDPVRWSPSRPVSRVSGKSHSSPQHVI